MRNIRQFLLGIKQKYSDVEKRKLFLRKKYKDDVFYRDKKLKVVFVRYLSDEEFKVNVKIVSK